MTFKALQADLSDIDFIHEVFMQGVEAGHFPEELLEEEQQSLVRGNMESVITQGIQRDNGLRAQAIVYEDDEQRIGFVIMSELIPKMGGNEMYVIAVDKNYRGKGYGNKILDDIIQRWVSHSDLYVRCRPDSEVMYHMLTKRGFKHFHTDVEDINYLVKKKES